MKSNRTFLHILLCLFAAATLSLTAMGCDEDTRGDGQPDTRPADTSSSGGPDTTAPDTSAPVDTAEADADTAEPPDTSTPDVIDPENPGPPPEREREMFTPSTGALQAGVAIGYFSGPVGIAMAGYGGRTGPKQSTWAQLFKATQGFYGYPSIKAMVLDVNGERLVFLKIPTMSSENGLTEGTAQKLEALYGIDLHGRIMTGATHSHHTHGRYWRIPDVFALLGVDTVDEEIIDQLSTAFAETIKRAIDDLGPAEYGFVYLDDWDPTDLVYRDRRGENNPTYPKDPRLSLLAVQRTDGTPMATLINFGMHGTAFGADNDLLTEDSAGALEMKFEEYFFARTGQPIFGMFIQSGGGDASPAGDRLDHPEEARLELLGTDAAPMIYDLYQQLQWQSEATLSVRSRRIDLRYLWMYDETYTDFSKENGRPYYWGGLQCADPPEGQTLEGLPKDCVDLGNMLRNLRAEVPHGEVHQTYLTTARINDLFFVSLPGEPAYSIIKYLRDEITARSTTERPLDIMAFGYSQDHLLYLTHPDDWFMGGYESAMSLWGPRAGVYFVDRQMELVDDMLEGFNHPVFYEESANRNPPQPFEPRAMEMSTSVGEIIEDTATSYERTQTVQFRWGGGDPTVGSPNVVLEREVAPGTFEPVPSPSGFEGAAYDNSRYYMITYYEPEPPHAAAIEADRAHNWAVSWQVPADWPAGHYRLVARGEHWDGTQKQPYNATSNAFDVVRSSGEMMTAILDGNDILTVILSVAPVAWVGYPDDLRRSWPSAGWRLLDPTVPHDAAARMRAPLSLTFTVDGGAAGGGPYTATFDEASGTHLFDFSTTGITLTGGEILGVIANLAGDHAPSTITTTVTQP